MVNAAVEFYILSLCDDSENLFVKRTHPDVLTYISTVLKITQKYLCTGTAVACCPMVVNCYAIILKQIIEFMTDTQMYLPARLYGAYIADIGLPVNLIISQTLFSTLRSNTAL